MLEGLDSIDWSRLTHAYGAATDVPEMIRGLMSEDPERRQEALYEAHGNIWHQGTVYEATAVAVPFLLEVLVLPRADQAELLELLYELANGGSYLDAHQHLSHVGEVLRRDPDFEQKRQRELGWVAAARRSVAAGQPVYQDLLAVDDVDARRGAARLLGVAEDPQQATRVLRTRLAVETDPVVRATILLAGLEVDVAAWREAAERAMRATDIERFAASLGLCAELPDAPSRATTVLLDVLETNDFEHERELLLGFGADTSWRICAALRRQSEPRRAALVAEVRQRRDEGELSDHEAEALLSALE